MISMLALHLDDIPYSCIQCGLSCGNNYNIPVSQKDYQRILKATGGKSKNKFIELSVQSDDNTKELSYQCKKNGTTCVFLTEDGLCEIHKQYGGTIKPLACQTFPFSFTFAPDGIHVGLAHDCQGTLNGTGKPLSEQREEIEYILHQTFDSETLEDLERKIRPIVMLTDKDFIDWKDYQVFESQLIDTIKEHDPYTTLLASLRIALSYHTEQDTSSLNTFSQVFLSHTLNYLETTTPLVLDHQQVLEEYPEEVKTLVKKEFLSYFLHQISIKKLTQHSLIAELFIMAQSYQLVTHITWSKFCQQKVPKSLGVKEKLAIINPIELCFYYHRTPLTYEHLQQILEVLLQQYS